MSKSVLLLVKLAIIVVVWSVVASYVLDAMNPCPNWECSNNFRDVRRYVIWSLIFFAVPIILEIVLYKKGVDRTLSDIGVTRFSARGVILAVLFSLLLLAFFPLFSLFTGIPLSLNRHWTWLMILTIFNGLLLEVMMRGFVFRHLRENWSFWRAAVLPPLFYAVATAIAIVTAAQGLSLGSLLLSSLIPVPIGLLSAYLYERGSNTLWGSVLLQFVVNALLSTVITPASPIGFHQLFFYPMIGITSAIVVVWIYLRGFGRETAPLPMEVINP